MENVDEGVTFVSTVPSYIAQLCSEWIYVCCLRLVGIRQNSIQSRYLGHVSEIVALPCWHLAS